MSLSKTSGVKCSQCGASTPLPRDLRIPTFECQYCHAQLVTANYAGEGAVRVDEMGAYLGAALDAGTTDGLVAPKLVHGTAGFRPLPCFACKAEVQVPLAITINTVACPSCGREAGVSRYISDAERLEIDMARQIAGNEELKRLQVEGLRCRRCNAHNTVAEPIEVQQLCTSCGGVILLSDHVPPDAVDRARLKASVYGIRDRALAINAEHGRKAGIVIAVVLVVVVGAVAAIFALSA